MDDRAINDRPPDLGGPHALGPADVTLDAPSDSVVVPLRPAKGGSDSGSYICVGEECRVHLVQGSGAELTGETENLLRSRLRSAALLMFAGFAAFLVWHTIRIELTSPLRVGIYVAHFACTMVLGLIGLALCRHCPMTTRKLRLVEAVAFGVASAFFC